MRGRSCSFTKEQNISRFVSTVFVSGTNRSSLILGRKTTAVYCVTSAYLLPSHTWDCISWGILGSFRPLPSCWWLLRWLSSHFSHTVLARLDFTETWEKTKLKTIVPVAVPTPFVSGRGPRYAKLGIRASVDLIYVVSTRTFYFTLLIYESASLVYSWI